MPEFRWQDQSEFREIILYPKCLKSKQLFLPAFSHGRRMISALAGATAMRPSLKLHHILPEPQRQHARLELSVPALLYGYTMAELSE